MKRTLKRYLALLLSLVMVGSMLTDAFSVAWAAGLGDSAAAAVENHDASSPLTGKPNLYVDFLGDNMGHNTDKTTSLGNLLAPERHDQSKEGKYGGTWTKYFASDVTTADTTPVIFWVGVGIDRMNVLDLFQKNDQGIYTTEIGFYYNDTFIEPYVGADGYEATITAANIGNSVYPNQWSDAYQVIQAETGLAPQTDWVTQENIDRSNIHDVTPAGKNDGMDQIMAAGSTWKMTYVSLEKKDEATGKNRFDGAYTGKFDGETESKNGETEYLLMIPFVLKKYDSATKICLRLARNAHLFSVGADGDGTEQYAAWERVTTRNPGHDLKLMTNFTGDLNIFTGKKELEEPWKAELQIHKGGGTANWAKMSVTDDPSPNKVVVDKNGDQITGLYGGTSLTVDVHVFSGYKVTVAAYKMGTEPPGTAPELVTVSTIKAAAPNQDGDYRLVLPEMDVTVVVTFTAVTVDTFYLALVEDRTEQAEGIIGNKTTVTVSHTESGIITETFIDSDTTPNDAGKRNITAKEGDTVTTLITTHPDYEAEILVVDPDGDSWPNYTVTAPTELKPGADAKMTLPAGGTFTLTMPKSDVDLHVKFVPAKTYTAKLVLDHDPLTDAVPQNVAQLSYTKYDKVGTGSRDYSGVVYHNYDPSDPAAVVNDHSAVESPTPNRVLRAVDASEAKRSGSLGGDGQGMTAQDWTRLMSYIYAATARTDLDNKLLPYDLRETVVDTKKADLRKNAAGDYYGDGDLSGFLDRMWTLHEELAADPTTAAIYQKTMPDPADSTKVLYTYYDLTPAQVQVYLLDWEQYDKDKAAYDEKKAAGDTTATEPAIPKLKDKTTAAGEMPASWPTAPTGGSDNFVTTRYDRELTLTLEANSAYRVKEIKVVEALDADAVGPARETTLIASDKDPNYANVYRFPMPTYHCEVRVVYEKRPVHNLSFAVVGAGLNVAGNASELMAFGPDTTNPAATVPATHKLTATIANPVTVFDGSTVTLGAKHASGYTTSLVVKTAAGSILINETNIASGKGFTFTMPADAVTVTVTYAEVAKPKHSAYIDYTHLDESGFADTAYWQAVNSPTTLNGVSQGTVLTGEIVVEKGFYIHSVRAYTKSGSLEAGNVSYVLSGNGYQNGGGGKETVTVTMPGEDLYVDVVFAKGPPPVEPDYNLSLMVSDPANVAVSGAYADNHATLTVEGGTPSSPVSAYGSTKSYSTYTNGGKLVTVDMTAADGYYVDSVTVSPSNFGVTALWKSETQVQFYMPGGDVGVTVTFGKGTKPTYFLNLDKTEEGGTEAEPKNIVKKVISNTIETILEKKGGYELSVLPARVPDSGEIGAAAAGETVSLDIEVLTGWYIDSLTITAADGSSVPYELPDNGYDATGTAGAVKTVTAKFQMPRGDAAVVVHYRLGPPPADKEYRLDVSVTDPDNVTDGTTTWEPADNWAQATVTRPGVAAKVVGPLGLRTKGAATLSGSAYAMMGDVVTVEFHPAAGYALDYIRLVSPVTGVPVNVVPVFTGPNTAVFTMPAAQTSVEVRFKAGAATQYTANLILRVPAGADYTVADAGQGTFTAPTSGTLAAPVYSAAAVPGAALNLDLFANSGYYIKEITITPASAEATAAWSGAFANQSGSFVMPPANVYVNVCFEKGWPDDATYDMTLKVTDPYGSPDNYANFVSVNGADLDADDKENVLGGGSRTVVDKAKDKDTVFVAIHQGTGYLAKGKNITITTAGGRTVDWTYAVEGGVSGIRFTMPPENVIIHVIYTKGTASPHNVTIYVADGTAGSNAIKFQDSPVTYDKASDYTSAHTATAVPGTAQKLELTPDSTAKVAAAYAVNKTTGEQLIIPVTQVAAGGIASFAMPEADVDVYVKFAADPVPDGEHVATLTVAGPANSGKATMQAVVYKADGSVDHTALTGDVAAGESGLLTAPKDSGATVTITPETGYLVKSVSVVDGTGAAVPFAWAGGSYDDKGVWTPAANQTLTFTMPDKDVHVLVILEKIPADLLFTAQVVVNDEAYTDTVTASKNGAVLKKAQGDPGALKLTDLTAGEQLLLNLTVHPGFKIESITVVPQEHGIVPGMALAPTRSQSTSLTMPADDVVVYVKFVKDGLVRYNATLDVTGTPGTAFKDNKATIESPVSGVRGPIATDDAPVSVQAAPGLEWVTVEYDIQANSSVASITVLDAAGNYVPFTQKKNEVNPATGHIDKGSITFPMVASNVRVIVDYQDKPTPKGHDAVIHVIDLDQGNLNASSWGSLTYTPPTTAPKTTDKVFAAPAPGGTGTISVPAGETVDLAAFADTDVYIKAAYVLFQEHNQMVECNLTPDGDPGYGFTDTKTSSFVMHPGQNDVYIYVTQKNPTVTEYASVLMLTGPEADKDSSARMVGTHGQAADVKTNGAHGYIAARTGETVAVTVTPAAGYAVESILMTPLGIPITPVKTGSTYTFTMPAYNVAVHIKLKESTAKEYTATLHLVDRDGNEITPPSTSLDLGKLSCAATGVATNQSEDKMEITVSEKETVELWAKPNTGNTILAAYVMKGATMVSLGDSLEGETGECATSFTMPNGNVDVYLVFTDKPPTGDWYTAVLVVTDDDGKDPNSKKNSATFVSSATNTTSDLVTSDGLRTHFYTVVAGERVTIHANDPASGYVLDGVPAISASSLPALSLTALGANTYWYAVPYYNSAVHVHYKSTSVTERDLTVRILDPDTPGDGTVTQTVVAEPAGMAALTVTSKSTAGAIQTIPKVEKDKAVSLTITPNPGYYPVAVLTYGTGADGVAEELTLKESAGVYTIDPGGSFPMPGENATLTVTFFRAYKATLTLKDTSTSDASNRPYMVESAFGHQITVDNSDPTKTLTALPNGTKLTTTVPVVAEQSQLVGVLLTVDSSTTVMKGTSVGVSPDDHDEYYHTISRAHAEVTVVIESQSAAPSHLAAVKLVNAPEGVAADTILSNITNPVAAGGAIWRTAKKNDDMSLAVKVPTGYRVELTAVDANKAPVAVSNEKLTADGTVTFTMPDADTQVTVQYIRTQFTATLRVVDGTVAGGHTVSMSDGSTTLPSDGTTISGLEKGDSIILSADPAAGTYLSGIILREKTTGKTEYLSGKLAEGVAYPGTGFPMPEDNVEVTVIFGETIAPNEKDLYIATVTTANPGGERDNRALEVLNQTTAGLPPADADLWAAGYEGDTMLVSYTVAPGYYAVVTAVDQSTNDPLTVLQQDMDNAGTAAITMPAADALITITYQTTPPTNTGKLTLTLVGHDGVADNGATLSVEGASGAIGIDGATWVTNGNKKEEDATVTGLNATVGNSLRLSASRQDSNPEYEIYRVTLSVKKGTAEEVTTDIHFNEYGATAAALMYMPVEDAEVTVYYRRIYTATLSIKDTSADKKSTVSMTDDRPGTTPVTAHNGKLTGLVGTEEISTTVTVDANARLVGVVYTTEKRGTRLPTPDSAVAAPNYQNDFTMDLEDVTVTAVLESQDGKSQIAMVEYTADSQGLDQAGNYAEVTNVTDSKATAGTGWTAAKEKDRVDVTVHLEEGYQAEILWVSAAKDRDTNNELVTNNEIYVNRKIFVKDGKTASFTMPDDDTIVLIRYIKGYTTTLDFQDNPQAQDDRAEMAVKDMDTITGTSDGSTVTYTNGTETTDHVDHVPAATEVTATGTPKVTPKTVRILKHTAFTGTSNVSVAAGVTSGSFNMPAENTLVSVIMDPNPLIAKVQLKGETDIVGNGVDIGNVTTPPTDTTHGTIWTTTREKDEIQVTLTVANGYIAIARVLRDDKSLYLANLGSTDGTVEKTGDMVSFTYQEDTITKDPNISKNQTFTFTMPETRAPDTTTGDPGDSATDVTVIVEFVYAGAIPRPHDPQRAADGALKEGYIYGENRGGYAVVTVPTLYDDKTLANADKYNSSTITYRFYLHDKTTGEYTELEQGKDILLDPADPDTLADPGDKYNYGTYYTADPGGAGEETYTGARFKLSLAETDDTKQTAQAKQLAKILVNEGTQPDTELYILAENGAGEQSAYVQTVIKSFYAISGTLVSYAPTHEATITLHRAMTQAELEAKFGVGTTFNPMDPDHYMDTPTVTQTLKEESGSGLWSQEFYIGSAELIPDPANPPTYLLAIQKPGHITYRHVALKLDTNDSAYHSTDKIFTITGGIGLIPGDVTGDWRVNLNDRDVLMGFLSWGDAWSTEPEEKAGGSNAADWAVSIYNPASAAYRSDLDGDGNITYSDLDILQRYMRYSYKDYNTGGALPNGFRSIATLDLAADLMEELLPEEQPEVPPEEPIDPDFSVDPEVPEVPLDPEFSVDPDSPVDPNPDADLPPTPSPDPVPDPVPPPPDPEEDPEEPKNEPQEETPPPEGEDAGDTPETAPEPQESPDTATE